MFSLSDWDALTLPFHFLNQLRTKDCHVQCLFRTRLSVRINSGLGKKTSSESETYVRWSKALRVAYRNSPDSVEVFVEIF